MPKQFCFIVNFVRVCTEMIWDLTFDCLLDAALHSISTEMAWRFELWTFNFQSDEIHKNKYYTSLTSQHLVQQLRVICFDTKLDIERQTILTLCTHKCLTDACKI